MTFLFSIVGELVWTVLDGVGGATGYWGDFKNAEKDLRDEILTEAPGIWREDGTRVIIDSAPTFVLAYDERGYFMEHRESLAMIVLRNGGLRRYRQRGIRGLRRERARLRRIKPQQVNAGNRGGG